MESGAQVDTTDVANNNTELVLPENPLIPSTATPELPTTLSATQSLSVARQLPRVPLSTFESLLVEIHILVVAYLIRSSDPISQVDNIHQGALAALACTAPAFTTLCQSQLYRYITIVGKDPFERFLASPATTRRQLRPQQLCITGPIRIDEQAHAILRGSPSSWSALRRLEFLEVDFSASALQGLTGLRVLQISRCEVIDDLAETITDFPSSLIMLFTITCDMPDRILHALHVASSSTLAALQIGESPPVSDHDLSFPHLDSLSAYGNHSALTNILSFSVNITILILERIFSGQVYNLLDELSKLPRQTLVTLIATVPSFFPPSTIPTFADRLLSLWSMKNIKEVELRVREWDGNEPDEYDDWRAGWLKKGVAVELVDDKFLGRDFEYCSTSGGFSKF